MWGVLLGLMRMDAGELVELILAAAAAELELAVCVLLMLLSWGEAEPLGRTCTRGTDNEIFSCDTNSLLGLLLALDLLASVPTPLLLAKCCCCC